MNLSTQTYRYIRNFSVYISSLYITHYIIYLHYLSLLSFCSSFFLNIDFRTTNWLAKKKKDDKMKNIFFWTMQNLRSSCFYDLIIFLWLLIGLSEVTILVLSDVITRKGKSATMRHSDRRRCIFEWDIILWIPRRA